jgi:hypothetical protein
MTLPDVRTESDAAEYLRQIIENKKAFAIVEQLRDAYALAVIVAERLPPYEDRP